MLFFKRWPVSYNTPYEKVGDEVRSLADEVPFDIPDSWEWVRLGSIGETNIGLTYKPSDVSSDGVPVLRSNNILNGQMNYSELLHVSCTVPERAYAHKGDILICARNGSRALVGKSAIVDADDMAFGAFMAIYRSPCNPYIQLFINSYLFRGQLEGATTTTINQVTQEMLKRQLCPLPPIQEQLRIVQKYTELQPFIAAYSNAYDKAQILNSAFPEALKKSILQEAVQGKLVPQDPSDEPAEALLERIRAEKQRLIKEGKIKKGKHESVIFRRDNSHYEKRGSEEACIDEEIPFEIPENWAWCRASSLGTMIRGRGIKRTETVAQGYPCIRYGEIYTTYETSFDSAVSFVPETLDKDCLHFSSGDVVFTLTGENKVDIAKTVAFLGDGQIAAGGDLAFWTHHGMNPLYLVYYMASPYCIELKRRTATGDIIVHISTSKVGDFLVPVPPINEQNRIVSAIGQLFAVASTL